MKRLVALLDFDRTCRVAWLVLASVLLWEIHRIRTGRPLRIRVDGIDVSIPDAIHVSIPDGIDLSHGGSVDLSHSGSVDLSHSGSVEVTR